MMELKRFALAMVGHFLSSLLYVLQRLHIVNAVVDTTSILEHREELRELWEKRMMADENQSSPSSTVETKPTEEVEVKENGKSLSQAVETAKIEPEKLANGHAKCIPDSTSNENDTNANPIQEKIPKGSEVLDSKTITLDEEDHENNNSADSLEIDNNNEVYVEEKTYTSQLETSLVVKQVTEVVKEDHEKETIHNESVSDETVTTTVVEGDGQAPITASPEKELTSSADAHEIETTASPLVVTEEVVQISEKEPQFCSTTEHVEEAVHDVVVTGIECESASVASMKVIDIPTPDDDEGDGFVPLAACLPQEDLPEDEQISEATHEDVQIEQHKTPLLNGSNGPSEFLPVSSTPEPSLEEKPSNPEIEQFVKSGGVKRILPGVQKTEQPYSSCTTETKIAMEIREMREREEELRVMREQAVLSPVVSPVPPKSLNGRSPSPSVKDCSSPTPSGAGYRVSSVFGHKGTISPSPPVVEDEKKVFKMAAKETAVEKEIRMAREREEELRNQKGLPPREDDSYVKPSQVKSSQVRIFNKAGANSASVKQAATAKIQLEIEEQTQREMALREAGSIQTISHERTDAKVAKLKTPECTTPPLTNGNSQSFTNGNGYSNGRHSPDVVPYKRSSPSPTGIQGRPASIFSQTNGSKSNISMQKFIASKGKETTFTSNRNGGPFILPKEDKPAAVPPTMIKLKRNVSVESKIQQEIMEMKQREDELRKLHMQNDENSNGIENGKCHEMNKKNNLVEFENGNGVNEEDISPRHNKLIAQWEQRIQKAES